VPTRRFVTYWIPSGRSISAPFWQIFEQLSPDSTWAYHNSLSPWLCLDGTQYFSSQKIHCAQCTTRVVNERTYYSHSLVAPLIVAPGQNRVIALEPEFVRPQEAARSRIASCAPPSAGCTKRQPLPSVCIIIESGPRGANYHHRK
jgi:hypothetical protein